MFRARPGGGCGRGTCVLSDLESHNVAHLNGAAVVGEAAVVVGDQIQCGDVGTVADSSHETSWPDSR